jgi:hypothetical protein
MSFFPLHSGFDWGYGHGHGHGYGNDGIVNNLVVSVNEEPRYYRRRCSPRYWGSSRSSSSGSSRSSSSGSRRSGSRRSGSGRN